VIRVIYKNRGEGVKALEPILEIVPDSPTALDPNGLAQPKPTLQSKPSQWSVYGQLRRTAFQKDGQPMYVLENKQGQALLYITTLPGFTLSPYVGKTLSIYGSINRSDDYKSRFYMTATSVSVLP
jgi:hypothetical protein